MMTRRMFSISLAFAAVSTVLIAWLIVRATDQLLNPISIPKAPEHAVAVPKSTPSASIEPRVLAEPKPPGNVVSAAVGQPLQSALTAVREKDFDRAKLFMAEAEAAAKTAYERFKVSEVWVYIYGSERNYKRLLSIYQLWLADSDLRQFVKPQLSDSLLKNTAITASAAREHSTAAELGVLWLKDHPDDWDVIYLVGQSHYQTQSYQSCRDILAYAIENTPRPSKSSLNLMRSCANQIGDRSGEMWALALLCQYYGDPSVWQDYIDAHSRNATEEAQYYWDRLRLEVAGRVGASDLLIYALHSLIYQQLPSVSIRTLEHGFRVGLFDADFAQRSQAVRLLEQARTQAQADHERIPALVNDAQADTTGQLSFELGRIYFDNNQFNQAIASLTASLAKGRYEHIAQIQMLLALAQLSAGNREAARTTFAIAGQTPDLTSVADAWILRTYNDSGNQLSSAN